MHAPKGVRLRGGGAEVCCFATPARLGLPLPEGDVVHERPQEPLVEGEVPALLPHDQGARRQGLLELVAARYPVDVSEILVLGPVLLSRPETRRGGEGEGPKRGDGEQKGAPGPAGCVRVCVWWAARGRSGAGRTFSGMRPAELITSRGSERFFAHSCSSARGCRRAARKGSCQAPSNRAAALRGAFWRGARRCRLPAGWWPERKRTFEIGSPATPRRDRSSQIASSCLANLSYMLYAA